jgi:hypothetical protein
MTTGWYEARWDVALIVKLCGTSVVAVQTIAKVVLSIITLLRQKPCY